MSVFLTIFLWILQGLLAALMLFHGWLYITMTPAKEEQFIARQPGMKPFGLSRALLIFIGVAELFAAIGLILPGITGILPWLTPLAATGLVIVMIGAVIYHQRRGEGKNMSSGSIILLLLLMVAILRWFVLPL
jgi:uncharacterized membrane protein YphA (DoxX/SURF4 family)